MQTSHVHSDYFHLVVKLINSIDFTLQEVFLVVNLLLNVFKFLLEPDAGSLVLLLDNLKSFVDASNFLHSCLQLLDHHFLILYLLLSLLSRRLHLGSLALSLFVEFQEVIRQISQTPSARRFNLESLNFLNDIGLVLSF